MLCRVALVVVITSVVAGQAGHNRIQPPGAEGLGYYLPKQILQLEGLNDLGNTSGCQAAALRMLNA